MTKEVRKEPEPFFYCKWGGTSLLCSDCKMNHLNSKFSTKEISNWWQPMTNGSRKWRRDYIKFSDKKQQNYYERRIDLFRSSTNTCRI